MENEKIITIGIPVFNDQNSISRCIDSALEQTSDLVKIIIADNCSTDDTSSICQDYASRHDKITYIRHEKNIGGYENFKFLAELCDTDYFMWLASDDWISKDFIKKSYDFLSKNIDYVLVTATSAYYDPNSNAFLFATSTSSIESNDSTTRAIDYINSLTDNSEFYGLYRASSIELDKHKVIGSDWLWGVKTAIKGKIKSIPGTLIHRNYKWNNPNRSNEIAISEGLPKEQAEQPHYATALFTFFNLCNTDQLGASNSNQVSLAWEVFLEFKSTKNVPHDLFIFNDCCKFFGIEKANFYLNSLKRILHEECDKIHYNKPSDLTLNKILEISLTLKTWQHHTDASSERKVLTGFDFYDFVKNSIDYPAYLCPTIPTFSDISDNLSTLTIDYLTYSVQSFQKEEQINLYCDHLMRVLRYFNIYFFNDLEIHPLRIPTHKKNKLELFIKRINMISTYFSDRNLKDIMIERGNLLRRYLSYSGIEVDYTFPVKAANDERKKIGLIAQSLNSPTDTYTSLPALSHLDRTKFETIIFTLSIASPNSITPMENYAATIADRVIHLNGGSNSELIECIRKENLDVILIGNNITAVSNTLSFISCARLARKQISFNPSCVTSGFKNIDYYISGTYVENAKSQDQYTENLILIDGPAHTRLLPIGEDFEFLYKSTRQHTVTRLVSGANFYKLTPNTIKTWINILKEIPDSTLSLYPFGPAWSSNYETDEFLENLKKEADTANILFDRVEILSPFNKVSDIRSYLQNMDIYLDSFPFSGINSLLDPLSVGLPVVCMNGNSFRSNMGASVLRELDLTCLLAESESEYISICKRLSTEPIYFEKISKKISDNLKDCRLYDTKWFSKQFEEVLNEL